MSLIIDDLIGHQLKCVSHKLKSDQYLFRCIDLCSALVLVHCCPPFKPPHFLSHLPPFFTYASYFSSSLPVLSSYFPFNLFPLLSVSFLPYIFLSPPSLHFPSFSSTLSILLHIFVLFLMSVRLTLMHWIEFADFLFVNKPVYSSVDSVLLMSIKL